MIKNIFQPFDTFWLVHSSLKILLRSGNQVSQVHCQGITIYTWQKRQWTTTIIKVSHFLQIRSPAWDYGRVLILPSSFGLFINPSYSWIIRVRCLPIQPIIRAQQYQGKPAIRRRNMLDSPWKMPTTNPSKSISDQFWQKGLQKPSDQNRKYITTISENWKILPAKRLW